LGEILLGGLASGKGGDGRSFCNAVFGFVPSFEKGERGRILHIVAPMIRKRLNDKLLARADWVERVLQLHDQLLGRVRRAVDC
jgi:hypothetical protein